jgi:hypothetical protein
MRGSKQSIPHRRTGKLSRSAGFCAIEEQVESANVSMDPYGVIVSPGTRKILRSTPSFPGGSINGLGRDSQCPKLAGSYRRKSVRRMLE